MPGCQGQFFRAPAWGIGVESSYEVVVQYLREAASKEIGPAGGFLFDLGSVFAGKGGHGPSLRAS
jgi:hypothetical protein